MDPVDALKYEWPAANQPSPADKRTKPSKGPNLVLLYSLLALALVAATVLALMIVLPFYHRR